MNKIFKGIAVLFGFSTILSVSSLFFNACQQDSESSNTQIQNASTFLSFCRQEKEDIQKASIKSDEKNRSSKSVSGYGFSEGSNSLGGTPSQKLDTLHTTLYVVPPSDGTRLTLDIKSRIYAAETIEDLVKLEHEFALSFHPQKIEEAADSVVFSLKETKEALKPLVNQSKEYLRNKGFSDSEITKMVTEEGATEEDLVALVILVSSNESLETAYCPAKFNPFGFVTPCYAAYSNSQLKAIAKCAIQAVGLDILNGLGQSTAKYWTKQVIKKAFKTVAKRALGPIGVGIAVVEFGMCVSNI